MEHGAMLLVNLGTQSLRGTVLNRQGNRLWHLSLPMSTRREGPVAEQDAFDWKSGLHCLLSELGKRRELASEIHAIAACGTLGGAVMLDNDGEPLRPALLYSDARADSCAAEIEQSAAFGALRRETGWRAYAGDLLPQVLWLAREEPETYARARTILDSTAYLNWLLTGCASLDAYSLLSCYARPSHLELPRQLLAELGLDIRKFGEPAAIGAVLGSLLPEHAMAYGLPSCPVVSIPYDSMTAYLGAGLRSEGDALDISGTVTSFGVLHPAQFIDGSRRVYSFPMPGEQGWLVRGSTSMSGGALEWARGELIGGGFDQFDGLVRESPPGARGVLFLPFLAGERAPLWTAGARGVFFGLTALTTKADMARAVYEGVCCSLRHIQSVMESGGVRIGSVKIAGGLSHNALLNRIKADITRKTLVPFKDQELTTLGGAAIAGRAIRWYGSLEEAGEALLRTCRPVEPDPANAALYDRQFRLYVQLVEQLMPLFQHSVETPVRIGR